MAPKRNLQRNTALLKKQSLAHWTLTQPVNFPLRLVVHDVLCLVCLQAMLALDMPFHRGRAEQWVCGCCAACEESDGYLPFDAAAEVVREQSPEVGCATPCHVEKREMHPQKDEETPADFFVDGVEPGPHPSHAALVGAAMHYCDGMT